MRTRSNKSNEISSLLLWGSEQCHKTSDSPRLDAEILLTHVLAKPRSYCRTWPEKQVSAEHMECYKQLIALRCQPTPVAYLVGYKEFWSRDFRVNPATLIPRPDTELLVEHAIKFLANSSKSVLDLGTGTGCIAITLQKECPNCRITATDLSPPALEIAKLNAQDHQADITFIQSSWFEQLNKQTFGLIVSNPPYIANNDKHLTQGDLPAEPLSALAAGETGLDDISLITKQAPNYLEQGGMLIIEHGYDQKKAVLTLFEQNGFSHIQQINDLGGQARVTLGIFLNTTD